MCALRLTIPSLLFLLVTACSGGGGGGGGGNGPITPGPTPPPPPPPAVPSAAQSGVVAACARSGEVRLDLQLPGTGFEAAVFQGASTATVYAGAPVATVTETKLIVSGLTDGVDAFFGLAIRALGATAWTPVGTAVRTRPGAPIFVDAAASAAGADGTTPATAFPSLQDALLVAGSQNGRNVWVRDGVYAAGPYALGPNVHAAGGFGAGFDLAERDIAAGGTRLTGTATQEIVSVQSGGSDASLDGFAIDGGGVAQKGVDIVDSDVELRSLTIRDCANRGVKALVPVAIQKRRLTIVGCEISGHTIDGVGTSGPYDLTFDLSEFDANGEEGIDVDNLDAFDGAAVSLRATGCRFYGNGFEGLDVDLAAAPGAPANAAGTFDVWVENCRFEVNGLDGLLIDQETEFFPGLFATIVVRGCLLRANRGAGLHVDADAPGTYRLELLRCTANAGDGVLITSESNPGEVNLGTSWLAGNLGNGARLASGNKAILASHCAFLGNEAGGLRSQSVTCSAVNCVFERQAARLATAVDAGNAIGNGAPQMFVAAPIAFVRVLTDAQGALTVADASGVAPGAVVRVADDDTPLTVTQVTADTVVLDVEPINFLLPGMLQVYAGTTVAEDATLAVDSPARGAGIAAPGATAVDAGPLGAADGGVPGHTSVTAESALRFLVASPAGATGVAATAAIELRFDRAIDATSVTADRVVVTSAGVEVTADISVAGDRITLAPTGAGWPGDLVVQVRDGVAAAGDGAPLGAAVLLPMRRL